MIILPNGDKWIIDESEYVEAVNKGLATYEEAANGILPETDVQDFVEQLILIANGMMYAIPRKHTDQFGGYWDGNHDPYVEVLSAIATNKVIPSFCSGVFQMPWGEILVPYYVPEQYDSVRKVARFPDYKSYYQAACFPNQVEIG